MACVTLKRPVEVLGNPHNIEQQSSPKRRCGISLIPSTPPSGSSRNAFKKRKRCLESDPKPSNSSTPMSSSFITCSPSGEFIFTHVHVHSSCYLVV